MKVQLLQLMYFKALAENQHLLNTAKELHISAPALSSTISKLEESLHTKLFNRIGRNIVLNDNGKALYKHVSTISDELDAIETEFLEEMVESTQMISVGVTATTLWNEAISEFAMSHPNIAVYQSIIYESMLSNYDSLNMLDCIFADDADFKSSAWKKKHIMYDAPVLLVNQNHPFAGRENVSLVDAQNEEFIALSKGYTSRSFMDNSCKLAGFVPKIVAEVDYLLRSQLIINGHGIGYSSEFGYKVLHNPRLVRVKVSSEIPARNQCLFYREDHVSDALRTFIKFIDQYFKEYK